MSIPFYYAGFTFDVNKEGKLTARPRQHPAAYKEKHRMVAQAIFDKEGWAGSDPDPEEDI